MTKPKHEKLECRYQLDLREAIGSYLARGWSIVCRDPMTIKRGKAVKVLIKGVLNHGS